MQYEITIDYNTCTQTITQFTTKHFNIIIYGACYETLKQKRHNK